MRQLTDARVIDSFVGLASTRSFENEAKTTMILFLGALSVSIVLVNAQEDTGDAFGGLRRIWDGITKYVAIEEHLPRATIAATEECKELAGSTTNELLLQPLPEGTIFTVENERQYELLRVVGSQIGQPDPISDQLVDHAYQPVSVNEQSWVVTFHSNAWWWIPRYFKKDDEEMYRTAQKAFAGGAHGEIWRGRRIDNNGLSSLILKRMRVGESVKLLEAGLREIFFGKQLAGEAGLFTTYQDHFFREEGDLLELWVVFEDAGRSLRSCLYTGVSIGDMLLFQHSWLWLELRFSLAHQSKRMSSVALEKQEEDYNRELYAHDEELRKHGKDFIRSVLKQLIEAVARLHSRGIVHRDIKPSNILCLMGSDVDTSQQLMYSDIRNTTCVLGDFSSAYNREAARALYTGGPSRFEHTDEYAPPEAVFGYAYGMREGILPSFDSWSIGVVALELLLGSPNVFSIDQRTRYVLLAYQCASADTLWHRAVLTHKLQKSRASSADVERVMYLAALSQYCIFNPSKEDWPLRKGDPLYKVTMTRESCTLADFESALQARDPLGLGFDSSTQLLNLIWQLLTFDPDHRISAASALQHPYFLESNRYVHNDDETHALESLMLDPKLDLSSSNEVDEYVCPKCNRTFSDWKSCSMHVTGRKHGNFCQYDKSTLPKCMNAHSMLPTHGTSGHCDIQGRRRVMEDFHAVKLTSHAQYYAILDGHNGNFASKLVASSLFESLSSKMQGVGYNANDRNWLSHVQRAVQATFEDMHHRILSQGRQTPHKVMRESGTTATIAIISNFTTVIASVGDSRAVLVHGEDAYPHRVVAVQLTKDHVASDVSERSQIEKRGGFVSRVNGLERVNGTLAITRSLGDERLATVLSREAQVLGFTRHEIRSLCGNILSHGVPCFLILASDGLWDTMGNDEAAKLVVDTVSGLNPSLSNWTDTAAFQHAAETLTLEAFVRGSSDNIGVCLVSLD